MFDIFLTIWFSMGCIVALSFIFCCAYLDEIEIKDFFIIFVLIGLGGFSFIMMFYFLVVLIKEAKEEDKKE